MFSLLKYSNNYKELEKKCLEKDIQPVLLFELEINDKNSTKANIDKLKNKKISLNPKYSALQITLKRIDNSTVGTINNLKKDFDIIIGLGGLNKVNRFFLEQTRIDFLQDPHNSIFMRKADFIHHFNSGINHVLCQLAKEREINFLTTLNFFENKKHLHKEVGRINQNLQFTRKYNIENSVCYIIDNENQMKGEEKIQQILSFFDISTEQKKEATTYLEKQIVKNKKKSSVEYVSEGISINSSRKEN